VKKKIHQYGIFVILFVCGMSPVFANADGVYFRIPKVDGLAVDGNGNDWGSRGFCVSVLTDPDGHTLPAEDFDVRFQLAWDARGLFVLATVQDDVAVEQESLSRLWRSDCVEISIAQEVGHPSSCMLAVAPGMDPRHGGELRKRVYDWRPGGETRSEMMFETASRRLDGGYAVEAMLPWNNLGIEPAMGTKIGLQVVANDDDGQEQSFRVAWFPAIAPADSSKMHGLILSDEPDEPVSFRVDREIDEGQYSVFISGAREMIGKEVIARSESRLLAQKKLTGENGRAEATFSWSKADNSDKWPPLRIEATGRTLAEYEELPTLEWILQKYVRAVGGQRAYQTLEARSYKGRYLIGREDVFRLEAYAVIPDKWTFFIERGEYIEKNGYDGSIGWTQGPDRIDRADHLSRSLLGWWLNPQGPVMLSRYFPHLRLVKKDRIEGNDVFVLDSESPSGTKRTLEFDARTGLLRRLDHIVILEDYRETEGIVFPFRVVIDREGGASIFELTEVNHNGGVDNRVFAMPDVGEVFPDAFQGIDDAKVLPMLKMKELSYRHGEMNVPCRDGRFLYDLIVRNNYKRGLEIGTYNGYSTLWLGLAFRKTRGKIFTVEIDPRPAREARENFVKAGLDDVIDARINDAFDEIGKLKGEFDFIFIDANKEDYGRFLEALKDRLKPGGALVGHNVTNSAREMQDFLEAIQNDPDLETTFHTISAEGISVSIKLPTLEQILERYVDAIGGKEAIAKLTTRVCQGRFIDDRPYAGPKQVIPFETFSKLPDMSLFVLEHDDNTEWEGFDGKNRWRKDSKGLIRRENKERSQMDYFLDPQNALRIYAYFPGMELMGKVKLRGHDVYVVENRRKSPHYTLYFDVETGLLIQIGYYELNDYRNTDGVLIPMRLEYSRKGGSNTYVFDAVRHNVPIEDKRFAQPKKEAMDLPESMR
jgi:predicted O-methyltransferase YrrM